MQLERGGPALVSIERIVTALDVNVIQLLDPRGDSEVQPSGLGPLGALYAPSGSQRRCGHTTARITFYNL